MDKFFFILTVAHFMSMGGIALYGVHRLWLLTCWHRHGQNKRFMVNPPELPPMTRIPRVTVQVPLYNEPMVAARIIDAVAVLAWPREKLDIQILDDSTDQTREIVQQRIDYWVSRKIPISAITRRSRTGYKAGALKNGMAVCKGEFIALFDADFIPDPDFLEKTIPWFNHSNIGMVQARWTFLNKGYSWLTRLQALLLTPHFRIEHQIRSARGLFFNFNGTAGVWRRRAIETSGGWQDDTVTEDLDLSYRAQMAGWKFTYLDQVEVLSELPVTLADFRTQQERWAKGSIQTARKILPRLIASPLPLAVKIEGVAHLMTNLCWVFGFILTVSLYPVLIYRMHIGIYQVIWFDLPLFCISTGAILIYYLIHGLRSGKKRFPWSLFVLPALSIGLAPCLALSVLKGMCQKGGVFDRTPKSGVSDLRKLKPALQGSQPRSIRALMLNLPIMLYSLLPLWLTWHQETWAALPLVFVFPLGFMVVIGTDLHGLMQGYLSRHPWMNKRLNS